MTYLVPGCAALLAFVFGAAAAAKTGVARFDDFVRSAGLLEVLPSPFRRPAAMAVVVAEAGLTAGLTITAFGALGGGLTNVAVLSFAAAGILLIALTLTVAAALRRGDRRPCRCFGTTPVRLSAQHLIRNLGLLLPVAGGLVGASSGTAQFGPAGWLVAIAAGVIVGLLITRLDDLVDLFQPDTQSTTTRQGE